MTTLVADAVIARLREWGVRRVFGYPGEGIDPLLAALRRAAGDPEYVGARHEEGAALMATGHAKYTGQVGCCLATHGPGAVHLLNGLYDAKLDGAPVVALVGQQHRSALGGTYQQELDTASLFKDVCAAVSVQTVDASPSRSRWSSTGPCGRRCRAGARRCVILPHDVQARRRCPSEPRARGTAPWSAPSGLGPGTRSCRPPPGSTGPPPVLAAGERPALLVGQERPRRPTRSSRVADRLGAGIATSLLGKPVLDEELP